MSTGRYTLEVNPVGAGGFGKVRKGTDNELERVVAVKVFDPNFEVTPEEVLRFKREAKTLAKLSHPNIPSVYDVEFDDSRLEIIFEYVDGTNLRSILDDEETVSLSECKLWFDQIASAVLHAHEHKILHRDIKPENIIVSRDRRHCYLVDFGIALSKHELDRLTGSDWIGTPGYMSPEQEAGDEELDESDDMYSIGVCLYEVLSGHRISQGDYEPLHQANELIPKAIDDLVKRCIDKKPRRLASVESFRRSLGQALSGHRSLSEVLTGGQLHELAGVIEKMTPVQFSEMKVGQRLLILQKCEDLVASDERKLDAARNEMLGILVRVGVLLTPEQYRRIIQPAVFRAYGTPDDVGELRRGVRRISTALQDAASTAANGNLSVVSSELLSWVQSIEMDKQQAWFYHCLRAMLNALLANPECDDEDAPSLATLLSDVNMHHRNKATDADYESAPAYSLSD